MFHVCKKVRMQYRLLSVWWCGNTAMVCLLLDREQADVESSFNQVQAGLNTLQQSGLVCMSQVAMRNNMPQQTKSLVTVLSHMVQQTKSMRCRCQCDWENLCNIFMEEKLCECTLLCRQHVNEHFCTDGYRIAERIHRWTWEYAVLGRRCLWLQRILFVPDPRTAVSVCISLAFPRCSCKIWAKKIDSKYETPQLMQYIPLLQTKSHGSVSWCSFWI